MNKLISILLLLAVYTTVSVGQVSVTSMDSIILTHRLVEAGPVPSAADPNGVYPYVSYCETSARPGPKTYNLIKLDNAFIELTICPDLGGKIVSMVHKPSSKEVLYKPEVIRHTRILPRFYFVAGGIEISFPISHSPSQNEHVLSRIDSIGERIYITCGERELRFGMQWSVEYSLGPEDTFLTQRVRYCNPGKGSFPWMSWSNAALPSRKDTEFHFPEGRVLSHSSCIDTLDWKTEGPAKESDLEEMTGFFWEDPDINAFGAYTPSRGCGLYHIASESSAPGMKLWSYGTGRDSSWATLSTAEHQAYIEIQGGPIRDQSIKLEMLPGEERSHTEFWFPVDKPMDIYAMEVPEVDLRDESLIPFFQWAREESVKPWLQLMEAYKKDGIQPELPPVSDHCWPPSGMETLGKAFEWGINKPGNPDPDSWYYYYGTWLAGCGYNEKAIELLSKSEIGLAAALSARLLSSAGDHAAAARAYRSIDESWIALHPQLVVERDKTLELLGRETLEERAYWLGRVQALQDEWIVERRVQLLLDQGKPGEAKALLLSADFQKVHQSYERTKLWFQICKELNEAPYPIPEQLGEDRLSSFGAYREFE